MGQTTLIETRKNYVDSLAYWEERSDSLASRDFDNLDNFINQCQLARRRIHWYTKEIKKLDEQIKHRQRS